jgi:hypothetical protein
VSGKIARHRSAGIGPLGFQVCIPID